MTLIATPSPLIIDHAEPPPGTWERESSHFPAPVSPFTKSLLLVEVWGREIAAETGSLIETVRFIEVGGWVYMRPVPFGERPGAPKPPNWLVPVLMRLAPPIRRRLATARSALNQDWSGRQIDLWSRRRPELTERIETLQRADRATMSDAELDEHIRETISLGHECLELHFRLHGALARDLRAFTVVCRDLLGWDEGRSLAMLAGTSTASTAAGRSLAGLAAIARRNDELAGLIGTTPIDRVLAADPTFAAAFAEHLDRYCFRSITYDVADPILAERPELVLGLIRDQLELGERPSSTGDGSSLIDEARALLSGAAPRDRARFEERLAKALRAYPVREDNAYVTVCTPCALLRTVGLEFGRRLVQRDRLDAVEDVFLLFVDEARSALIERTPVRDLIDRRRSEREWTLAHPGPSRYGPEPDPMPAVDRLPAPARESVRDMLWLLDQVVPNGITATGSDELLSGMAASRGRATGTVCVVADESLSHPAIVAREFGIPAVVATGDATARLRDGQRVVVDGTAGTVRILS